MQAKKNINVHM